MFNCISMQFFTVTVTNICMKLKSLQFSFFYFLKIGLAETTLYEILRGNCIEIQLIQCFLLKAYTLFYDYKPHWASTKFSRVSKTINLKNSFFLNVTTVCSEIYTFRFSTMGVLVLSKKNYQELRNIFMIQDSIYIFRRFIV